MTMRKKRQPQLSDIQASLALIRDEQGRRRQQRNDAETTRVAAQEARQAAQEHRDQLRIPALADGDVKAREAYAQACADFRAAADAADERAALIQQLDAELHRLRRDERAAVQAEARVKVDTLGD